MKTISLLIKITPYSSDAACMEEVKEILEARRLSIVEPCGVVQLVNQRREARVDVEQNTGNARIVARWFGGEDHEAPYPAGTLLHFTWDQSGTPE